MGEVREVDVRASPRRGRARSRSRPRRCRRRAPRSRSSAGPGSASSSPASAIPAACAIRPQFASRPVSAVLTSGEFAIARATRSASAASAAPVTSTRPTRSAPSPSATTSSASCSRTESRRPSGRGFPAAPVAWRRTVSLVLIWPSTVIRSNEPATARRSAASGSGISASVCTKQSMVAKPGSIIPAPFAWAETVTPPARSVHCFGPRSVVMIARVNSAPPSAASVAAARSIPSSTGPITSGTPITPVSATATARGLDAERGRGRPLHRDARPRTPARPSPRSRCPS